MCCLFGLIDYNHDLTRRQKNRIVQALAEASEARGTDAAGIAYVTGGNIRIHKRPGPAHSTHFVVPRDSYVVMGHTRMTTQGSAKKNENNHPFPGNLPSGPFALAHNGVLYNDRYLRWEHNLPETKIETDSYIAVQLLEKQKALNFDSLRFMAEQVDGSFCFTVLDKKNRLHFVKGDNPLCLYHYPQNGLYLYASTDAILKRAIAKLHLTSGWEEIPLICGNLMTIHPNGRMELEHFSNDGILWRNERFFSWWDDPALMINKNQLAPAYSTVGDSDAAYLMDLKMAASWCGYEPEEVDAWLNDGFTIDDIEEFLYCGEL